MFRKYLTSIVVFILLFSSTVFSKNIAIMPFNNIAKDKDKNWIGAGFAETLTTKLVKVKEINLLEREQLSKILDEIKFQLSGLVDEKTAVKTGKMYGVDVMVLGSYQVMGNTLRVSARFVDVETRKVMDTAEATGNISDIFKLQDEIAFSLMDSLQIVLGKKEKQEIKANSTENLAAYQWFSKGNDALNLLFYDKAIEYYQKAISINPEYADAYFRIGLSYFLKDNDEKAIEMFEKVLQINPEFANADAGIYKIMGNAYYAVKGNSDKAIELYKKAISINPKDIDVYMRMGNAYADKGDYDKAKEMYEKVVSIDPKNAYAYSNMGDDYAKKEDFIKAKEMYEKAISVDPENPAAYTNMGSMYASNGNIDKAIELYEKSISVMPKNDFAWHNLGNIYINKGNLDKAIEMYEKAVSIDPQRNVSGYYNIGNAYNDKGDYDKAIEMYDKALNINPKDSEVYYNMGIAYSGKGNYDKAIKMYEKVISISPDNGDAYNDMATLYFKKGDYEKGCLNLKHAAKLGIKYAQDKLKKLNISYVDVDNAGFYLTIGNLYVAKEKYNKAIEMFEKAISVNPESEIASAAYYNIGITYGKTGNAEKAIKYIKKSARLGFEPAQKNLRELREKLRENGLDE